MLARCQSLSLPEVSLLYVRIAGFVAIAHTPYDCSHSLLDIYLLLYYLLFFKWCSLYATSALGEACRLQRYTSSTCMQPYRQTSTAPRASVLLASSAEAYGKIIKYSGFIRDSSMYVFEVDLWSLDRENRRTIYIHNDG